MNKDSNLFFFLCNGCLSLPIAYDSLSGYMVKGDVFKGFSHKTKEFTSSVLNHIWETNKMLYLLMGNGVTGYKHASV